MHSVLNEGFNSPLGAIVNLFTSKKDRSKEKKLYGTDYLNGSISKYSKNLIMSFPLLCDAGISVDTAMMVSRANERNIVNMLQILFASLNLNLNKNAGGADVIAAMYKDLDPNMAYNDFIDMMDKMSGGTTATQYAKIANESAIKELMNQFKNQKPFRKDNLNERSIADYTVKNICGKTVVAEAPVVDPNVITDYQKAQLDQKNKEQQYKEKQDQVKDAKDKAKDIRDEVKQVLNTTNIKKANDLEPTLMVINYNTVEVEGDKITQVIDRKSFLAGIKSRVIPVESVDIVERFVSKDRTKLSLKNLIRATTGEISLFKDFILCLDKLKIDAKNAAKKGPLAQYWNILEKRSIKNNVRKLQQKGNDGSAITTVVVSQDSVNFMKNAYRFDLEDLKNAKMIMDSYNLLGLIICDEVTEAAKVLYDGYNEFETISYTALDKMMNDRQFKNIANIINQVGR